MSINLQNMTEQNMFTILKALKEYKSMMDVFLQALW